MSSRTRAMRSRGTVLALITMVGLTLTATASQAPNPPMPAVEEVADNLYLLAASDPSDRSTWTGGNTAVFLTRQGVVLVDTKLPGYGSDFLDRVAEISDQPVTMIINTHTHFDHSGSNNEFPDTVTVVAHENTRANMARSSCEPVTNCDAFKGENAKFLPKRTFSDRMTLFDGPDQIDLYHFGPGHTDGDSFVVFTAARIMHTGDMFQSRNMPFIDFVNSGGSATEFAQTLRRAESGIDGVDRIIAGHSNSLLTWNDFAEYVEFMNQFFAAGEQGMRSGASVEAVASGFLGQPHDGFEIDPQRVRDNLQAIYDGR